MILITIPTTHILTGKQKSEGGSLRAGKFLVTFPETTSPFERKITLRQISTFGKLLLPKLTFSKSKQPGDVPKNAFKKHFKWPVNEIIRVK